MSGPVFAIRVPPRLQELISPTIKDVKSSGQHAKNRRRKVGMRVRMTGAGREYVWGRIGTMTSVQRARDSFAGCDGVQHVGALICITNQNNAVRVSGCLVDL